jgi:hypothetical protein
MKRKLMLGVMLVAVLVGIVGGVSAQDGRGGRDRAWLEERHPRLDGPVRAALRIIIEQIGLEPADVLAQLRDGQTLSAIITGSGGSLTDVTAALTEAATEQIATALENGRISQERADQMLANLAGNIDRLLNTTLQDARVNSAERRLAPAVADAAGIPLTDVLAQIQGGQTLGAILSANGIDPAAFTAGRVAQADERLTQAVENGRITQERADSLLTRYEARITALLNGTLPELPAVGSI